ncbi:MAG: AAA family ATPase [Erysipelotrichaceae bacterium]|nr:AAA family ATPase [Erysipelotrichaceae bacterium]
MFLKRIEMQGFKSFAERVVINFDNSVTGVVGPNGCGKSNITDAIRWVLGEQSVKNLRGSSMEDVIFNGSADRSKVNMAEVTLIFDNSNKSLNSELEEIEITRRLYRNKEAEYLINRNRVRLKDVVDLILDSGLGKDSLSMISQGNITQFAESKPIDRRPIFEEAAGVAKYKKRKIETLAKLERTKENLDRIQDIVNELEKQVSPLKKQAKKAEIYREKKQRLEEIEINVLVSEIESVKQSIVDADKEIFDIETQVTIEQTSINVMETNIQESKKDLYTLDNEINALQDKMLKTVNEIQILETRKIEIDEKRKYAIEVGDNNQKIYELQNLLNEAKAEFDDRKSRYDSITTEIKLLSTKLSNTALDISDYRQEYETNNNILRKLQNRKEVLENTIKEPFNNQFGVKSIIENKNSLNGVLGVVAQVLKPKNGYEEAISVAIGGAMYNIITTDEYSARNAINFLKKNQSGRATFLPLNVLSEKFVNREHEIICQNFKGFLGKASDFIDNEEKFDIVKKSLLNNVLVVDTLENGNELSAILKYIYKIVTLDGEVIHKGGSITGGKIKNSTSLITVEKELKDIINKIESQEARVKISLNKLNESQKNRGIIENSLTENRISLAQLESVVDAKRAKYERLKNDLEQLNPENLDTENSVVNDVIISLNSAYSQRDEITNSIRNKRDLRLKTSQETERKEQQIRQLRKSNLEFVNKLNNIKIDKAKQEVRLTTNIERLSSEYQMTFEFAKSKISDIQIDNAKEEVLKLRSEIDSLGNINMNAPEEFEEINTRYEFTLKQVEELKDSSNKLLKAIDEMDSTMTKQFKETFDLINNEFNEIFRNLFGGGKARVVLEDVNDILNTGIDIDVQPPGKSIQNIRLLSGGEKSLIAICVLFAILKVKSVPLVIFDEVEAALDQGNVERFAKYLNNFTDKTQFIVVTHRPGTMQQCNVLYGVTMQKQGVSQMLKVELTTALEMSPESEAK